MADPSPPPPQHPADQLYDRMVDLFGTSGNELFVMEWPARALDLTTYAYDVTSVYSGLTKPQPVLEAEFRLSNGMIDVSPLVGGSNGQQLSVAFNDALNQLVPAYTEVSKDFQADRETLRSWLLEPMTAEYIGDHGEPVTIKGARVEIYDALNERYLEALAAWDEKKSKRLAEAEQAHDSRQALEVYAKWLAEEAPAVEAELESKFADAVVKGYYHEVRSAVATLDISTLGEALENAKARMRASGMSSLDESETVYPVQFQPQDWFRGLSTDFQPQDLLLDPAALQLELVQKQTQIQQLEEQVTFLESTHTGDEAALQAKVDQARTALDDAQTALTNAFAENVLTVARMYFGTVDPSKATSEALNEALKESGLEGGLTDAQWTALKEGFEKVNGAQQALTAAGRELVDLQAAEMAAKATDNTETVTQLKAQIAALQQQMQSIEATLYSTEGQQQLQHKAVTDAKGNVTFDPMKDPNVKVDKDGKFSGYTMLPTPMPAPGEFFDVIFTFTSKTSSQTSKVSSSAEQIGYDVDLFFGSSSGSSESSESDAASKLSVSGADIQIGFRAMKVALDRGGWFDPTVLGMTAEAYHLGLDGAYTPISNGAPNLKDGYKDAQAEAEYKRLRTDAVLPAFPTSFLVVKDVTIMMALTDTTTAQAAHEKASSSSYSGGIFCFSVSGSSSSSSESKSAFSSAIGSNVIIKIPGPQILGWFLEYVPKDESQVYAPMPPNFLPPTAPELVTTPAAATAAASPSPLKASDLAPEPTLAGALSGNGHEEA